MRRGVLGPRGRSLLFVANMFGNLAIFCFSRGRKVLEISKSCPVPGRNDTSHEPRPGDRFAKLFLVSR